MNVNLGNLTNKEFVNMFIDSDDKVLSNAAQRIDELMNYEHLDPDLLDYNEDQLNEFAVECLTEHAGREYHKEVIENLNTSLRKYDHIPFRENECLDDLALTIEDVISELKRMDDKAAEKIKILTR